MVWVSLVFWADDESEMNGKEAQKKTEHYTDTTATWYKTDIYRPLSVACFTFSYCLVGYMLKIHFDIEGVCSGNLNGDGCGVVMRCTYAQ